MIRRLMLGCCLLLPTSGNASEPLRFDAKNSRIANYHGDRLMHSSAGSRHQLRLSHAISHAERMRNHLLADISDQDLTTAKQLASKHLKHTWPMISERSTYVRYRMMRALEAKKAPLALQVIPIVESTYNPYALSHAGAVGLWQLMPGTAKVLGIKKPAETDGRRDVDQATEAAATYLIQMYERFDSWPLALAAYNLGPNGLSRRLNKRPWDSHMGLDALPVPSVTRNYVKQIIGLVAILEEGKLPFPKPIVTRPLKVTAPVDITLLATLSGMEKDAIFRFNPGLNQAQYLRSEVIIHVPDSAYQACLANLSQAGPKFVHASVKRGDSLWSIARSYGTDTKTLKHLNRNIGRYLKVGQKLKVPANRLARASAEINPLLPSSRRIRYRVRSGDSLWRIANRFGTSVKALTRINSLTQNSIIKAGDILWVRAHVRPG